jgi:alpha-tubulin suppressor-like RCC1 family protein
MTILLLGSIPVTVHTLVAASTAGMTWAWGDNSAGGLGDGSTTGRATPVQVSGLTSVTAIAGGWGHSLTVKLDGTVWAWGYNYFGQLGDGSTTDFTTQVQVSGITRVATVAGGMYYSLALKSDGTVWSWGYNNYGQLGDGSTTERHTPVQVSGLAGVTAIAAGPYHCLALKLDGTVWAWGYNYFGQLGDGSTTDRTTPVQVSGLNGVIAIAAGAAHSLALKSDGTVWSWGYNGHGQLGDGSITERHTPVQVSGLTTVIAIAPGLAQDHSLALKSDGTVWSWGYNNYGQLGDGSTTERHTPVQVSELAGVTTIAVGAYHCLALNSDGTVWSWGYNNRGQLGDGSTTNRTTPGQVSGLTTVIAIASGGYHGFALKQNNVADTTPPAVATNLTVVEATASSVTLTWTTPGDDGNTGTATTYDIRYSTSLITEANWVSATQCVGEPTPKIAGSNEIFTVTDLSPITTYYFALKTADEVPNWSELSNTVNGNTKSIPLGTISGEVFVTTPYAEEFQLSDVKVFLTQQTEGNPYLVIGNTTTDHIGHFSFTSSFSSDNYNVLVLLEDGSSNEPAIFSVYHNNIEVNAVSPDINYTAGSTQNILMDFNYLNPNLKVLDLTIIPYSDLSPASLPPDRLDDLAAIYYHTKQAVDFAQNMLGIAVTLDLPLELHAYSDAITEGSAYDPSTKEIYMHESDSAYSVYNRPVNREWHEFFHYLMDNNNLMPTIGPGNVNHGGFENLTTVYSWVEGWAEFWPCILKQSLGGKSSPSVYIGGLDDKLPIRIDIEESLTPWSNWKEPWSLMWSPEEFAVAGLLWDLTDSPSNKENDFIQISTIVLWDILDDSPIDGVHSLYLHLKAAGIGLSDTDRNGRIDLDELFAKHGFFGDKADKHGNYNHKWEPRNGEVAGWGGKDGRL